MADGGQFGPRPARRCTPGHHHDGFGASLELLLRRAQSPLARRISDGDGLTARAGRAGPGFPFTGPSSCACSGGSRAPFSAENVANLAAARLAPPARGSSWPRAGHLRPVRRLSPSG